MGSLRGRGGVRRRRLRRLASQRVRPATLPGGRRLCLWSGLLRGLLHLRGRALGGVRDPRLGLRRGGLQRAPAGRVRTGPLRGGRAAALHRRVRGWGPAMCGGRVGPVRELRLHLQHPGMWTSTPGPLRPADVCGRRGRPLYRSVLLGRADLQRRLLERLLLAGLPLRPPRVRRRLAGGLPLIGNAFGAPAPNALASPE